MGRKKERFKQIQVEFNFIDDESERSGGKCRMDVIEKYEGGKWPDFEFEKKLMIKGRIFDEMNRKLTGETFNEELIEGMSFTLNCRQVIMTFFNEF
jgi:hypothetical protein